MADGPTRAQERAIIAFTLQNLSTSTAYTTSTIYVGLYSTDVSALTDAPANNTGELAGNNYARATCSSWTFSTATASASNPTVLTNNTTITFNSATPARWGTVYGFGLFRASAGTTAPFWLGSLDQAKTVEVNDNVSIASGQVRLIIGNPSDTYTGF